MLNRISPPSPLVQWVCLLAPLIIQGFNILGENGIPLFTIISSFIQDTAPYSYMTMGAVFGFFLAMIVTTKNYVRIKQKKPKRKTDAEIASIIEQNRQTIMGFPFWIKVLLKGVIEKEEAYCTESDKCRWIDPEPQLFSQFIIFEMVDKDIWKMISKTEMINFFSENKDLLACVGEEHMQKHARKANSNTMQFHSAEFYWWWIIGNDELPKHDI